MRVRDVLAHFQPAPKVLTAAHQLDAPVTWPHISDQPDPGPYLLGGELVLTNGLWASDEAASQRFVKALADHKVAAVGLALLPGQKIPLGLVAACERRDVLLALLPDVPFRTITEAIMTTLLEERRRADAEQDQLVFELAQRIDRGEGPDALASALDGITGIPCTILLRDGTTFGALDLGAEEIRTIWRKMFPPNRRNYDFVEFRGLTAVAMSSSTVSPPNGEKDVYPSAPIGAVVWRAHPDEVSAAAACARLVAHAGHLLDGHQSSSTVSRKARDSMVRGLLASEPGSAHDRLDFATRLWGAKFPLAVSLLSVSATRDDSLTRDALEVAIATNGFGPADVIAPVDGEVCAILTDHGAVDGTIADQVQKSMQYLLDSDVQVGIASGSIDDGLGRLLIRAQHARTFAGIAHEQGSADARSAGSHLLLLALVGREALETLDVALLAPVDEYDHRHGTRLFHTLATFLDNNGAWQQTAASLNLHVNSLRYRISRIEELTGRRLTSMTDRVDLFLAVQSRRHIGSRSSTSSSDNS